MRFREWYYMEMGGIRTMDTSGIDLHTLRDPFDSYQAHDECQTKAKQQEFYKGIYEYPEQDPEYDGKNDEWWEKRNDKINAIRDQYNRFIVSCVEQERVRHQSEGKVSGFKHTWTIDGKSYYAYFNRKGTPTSVKALIGEVPNIFSITFEGPEGYELTHKAGGSATSIYTQLLGAAKKVMESVDVNGWYFSPADDKMALMYRKFFEDYLQKDFIQPIKYFYLKKSFLKEKLKNLPPETRQALYSKMLSSNRDMRSDLQRINQEKINARNAFLSAKQHIGKVVGYRTGYADGVIPVYVTSIKPNGIAELYMLDNYDNRLVSGTRPIVTDRLAPTAFTDTKSIEPDKLERFMTLLKQRGVGV